MIFRRNEKTLMNLVPNKLELQVMGDPENRAYMLRPEARFNGSSQLSNCLDDPDHVANILDNCEIVPITAKQGQITSLI